MRLLMGIFKNRHGTFNARKKVPLRLQQAVAALLGAKKSKQTFLQKSLETKEIAEANKRAKRVLIDFDDIISRAEATLRPAELRETLSAFEIKRLADYHYTARLANDAAARREGAVILKRHGKWPERDMRAGLTADEHETLGISLQDTLNGSRSALARGDVTFVDGDVEAVLETFGISLAPHSAAYRELGFAILTAEVRALEALIQRQSGAVVETPVPSLIDDDPKSATSGETLSAAFEGWLKARAPSPNTLAEYRRAIALFVQLHGDIPIAQINRKHARTFREALQDLPRHRAKSLFKADLKELAEWGQKHPEASKIQAATINKLLGGVQSVGQWARVNGIIPEETAWSDPFSKMRLEEAVPGRESYTSAELTRLFGAPVFVAGARPMGGQGEAAFWLPLLALFTGARLSEIAGLEVANVIVDEATETRALVFVEERSKGKSLKTAGSARTVPIHPELIRIGFMTFVASIRHGWLFESTSPEHGQSQQKAWSKWYGHYLRAQGVTDRNKVFHSFRHGFKDALRAARISEDLNDALTGHSNGSVGRRYGAKNIAQRFGMKTLNDAVASVEYPGLDLSRVRWKSKSGQVARPKQRASGSNAK